MPKEFKNRGIGFLYPDNWELEVEASRAECRAVTVFSPGGGFWSVAIHPRTTEPADLAEAALSAMEEEYDEIDKEPITEVLDDVEMVGYDLRFFSLDLTSSARIRTLRTDRASYTVFCQAEDEDFAALESVFLAITISLLRSIQDRDTRP